MQLFIDCTAFNAIFNMTWSEMFTMAANCKLHLEKRAFIL